MEAKRTIHLIVAALLVGAPGIALATPLALAPVPAAPEPAAHVKTTPPESRPEITERVAPTPAPRTVRLPAAAAKPGSQPARDVAQSEHSPAVPGSNGGLPKRGELSIAPLRAPITAPLERTDARAGKLAVDLTPAEVKAIRSAIESDAGIRADDSVWEYALGRTERWPLVTADDKNLHWPTQTTADSKASRGNRIEWPVHRKLREMADALLDHSGISREQAFLVLRRLIRVTGDSEDARGGADRSLTWPLMNYTVGADASDPYRLALEKERPQEYQGTLPRGPNAVSAIDPARLRAALVLGQARVDERRTRIGRMWSTSGFRSPEALAQAMTKTGPEGARVVKFLQDPDAFVFAMNRPEESRRDVLAQGLRSVHETQMTKGGVSHDGTAPMRAAVEAYYAGDSIEKFTASDNAAKPQYGYAMPNWHKYPTLRPGMVGYGTDTYIFKRERVEPYLTFTPGDSLNRWKDEVGESAVLSKTRLGPEPKSWDQGYVPWSQRMILAPMLRIHSNDEAAGIVNVEEPTLPKFKMAWSGSAEGYIELQYHRPLDFDELEAFVFRTEPPKGAFLEKLQAKGVPIYDGRGHWPPDLWTANAAATSESK
jgi:hypothetical protein